MVSVSKPAVKITLNKKGQVIDFINFNSNVRLPVYMSNKVGKT